VQQGGKGVKGTHRHGHGQ